VRILFDQGTPVPLRNHLPSHEVATAFELHWSTLTNGDLLQQAEARHLLISLDRAVQHFPLLSLVAAQKPAHKN
jgi:hypothetical protein